MILCWGHSNAVTVNASQQWPSVLAHLTLEDAQLKGLRSRWPDDSEAEMPRGLEKMHIAGPTQGPVSGACGGGGLRLHFSQVLGEADAGSTAPLRGTHGTACTCFTAGFLPWRALGSEEVSVTLWTVLRPRSKESAHIGLQLAFAKVYVGCPL